MCTMPLLLRTYSSVPLYQGKPAALCNSGQLSKRYSLNYYKAYFPRFRRAASAAMHSQNRWRGCTTSLSLILYSLFSGKPPASTLYRGLHSLLLCDYRPISLTPIVSRILEKIVTIGKLFILFLLILYHLLSLVTNMASSSLDPQLLLSPLYLMISHACYNHPNMCTL